MEPLFPIRAVSFIRLSPACCRISAHAETACFLLFTDSFSCPRSKLQTRLRVVAIIDPVLSQSKKVLDEKRSTFVELAYRDTLACASIDEFYEQMTPAQKPK